MTIILSLTEIIAGTSLLITVVSIFGTIIWNLWKRVIENTKDLDRFKLQVAQHYASYAHITQLDERLIRTEEKLLKSIESLTARIDTLLSLRENR